jgi:hypothetical protein
MVPMGKNGSGPSASWLTSPNIAVSEGSGAIQSIGEKTGTNRLADITYQLAAVLTPTPSLPCRVTLSQDSRSGNGRFKHLRCVILKRHSYFSLSRPIMHQRQKVRFRWKFGICA